MATGSIFQSVGPTIAKARSPRCFNLDLGIDKVPKKLDLSGLMDLCVCNNSVR